MYACIVKNSQGTWDIFNIFPTIPDLKRERIDAALQSGFPITARNLTEFGTSVRSGAIWDGTQFNGGDFTSMIEGSLRGQYSYLCNDMIILTLITQLNTEKDEQMVAIFESETTVVKIPEGQTVNIGDIWDGEKVVNKL
jgi:hypothetical protein